MGEAEMLEGSMEAPINRKSIQVFIPPVEILLEVTSTSSDKVEVFIRPIIFGQTEAL